MDRYRGMAGTVVIVGAGQAGAQAAASLRQEGFDGRVVLVGEEDHLPYQRPPLSKGVLSGKVEAEATRWRPASFYADNRIELRLGERVAALDRGGRQVSLASGEAVAFDHLVVASGTRPRRLTIAGGDHPHVLYLRTLADAGRLGAKLAAAREVVVIGGGFIGLEVAATARALGRETVVLEAQERLMARSVARATSAHFLDLHRARGADIRLGHVVDSIADTGGRAVVATSGGRFAADLVLVGIGALANDAFAAAAGFETANGIVVDRACRTADPAIFAIGDCAVVADPETGRRLRLESVQNAVDQGKAVAALILGREPAAWPIPWFWSDQHDAKLQIAGVADAEAETEILRGDPASGRFSVFRYAGPRLAAVDSVNAAGDHMVARRLLAAGSSPAPGIVADPAQDLREIAKAAAPAG